MTNNNIPTCRVELALLPPSLCCCCFYLASPLPGFGFHTLIRLEGQDWKASRSWELHTMDLRFRDTFNGTNGIYHKLGQNPKYYYLLHPHGDDEWDVTQRKVDFIMNMLQNEFGFTLLKPCYVLFNDSK